jgi:hypothetical protein
LRGKGRKKKKKGKSKGGNGGKKGKEKYDPLSLFTFLNVLTSSSNRIFLFHSPPTFPPFVSISPYIFR